MAGAIPPLSFATLLRLAVPSAVFTVLTNSYRIVDQFFVQRISVEAQAAVGASIFVLIVYFAAFEIVSAGAGPLVARATGAGDDERRRVVFGAACAGALLITVLVMLVGAFGSAWMTRSLGLTGETAVECERYLVTLSLTVLPVVFTPLVDHVFLAMGNARGPMMLHAATLGLNIVITPLLIERYGIVGAALASTATRAVTTGVGLVWLLGIIRPRLSHVFDLRPVVAPLRRVVRVGLPIAANTSLYAAVYWGVLNLAVSPLGPAVNAALGIGFSALEGFTWPVFHGLSLGTASLVGRYLGAGEKELARRTVRLALPASTVVGVLASAAFYFAGSPLTGLFTDDVVVHAEATTYAVILAASQLFVAWEALGEGVLAGAGDTRTVFWWSAPFNIARVPLAWAAVAHLGLGAAGVWWVINVTTYAKALGKGWATWRGRWLDLEP